uniref:Uncharacterized protein n=1 Tax=Anopheles atroparvus TaxID=41427 RepID=A0AAG5DHD4_ANOAO
MGRVKDGAEEGSGRVKDLPHAAHRSPLVTSEPVLFNFQVKPNEPHWGYRRGQAQVGALTAASTSTRVRWIAGEVIGFTKCLSCLDFVSPRRGRSGPIGSMPCGEAGRKSEGPCVDRIKSTFLVGWIEAKFVHYGIAGGQKGGPGACRESGVAVNDAR